MTINLPENPMNGDVIKALFPNIKIWKVGKDVAVDFSDKNAIKLFPLTWWYAPYKREVTE